MNDYSNNNNNNENDLIGNSPFTYCLKLALRNFGIHIHNDFIICLANLPFNLNYNPDTDPDDWLVEYIPQDILEFLSVTTGITLLNNEFPMLSYYPHDIEYPILVFGKWDGIRNPVWGYAKKIISEDTIEGQVMDFQGILKNSTTKRIIQVIVPELSSFQISYEDIIKSIGKNALKYLGYSGPVFTSGNMYGVEFFQIWMEDLDEKRLNIQPGNTARFCSILANNAKAAGSYFTSSPYSVVKEMGILFESLSDLLSPFGKQDDIRFILETENQLDFLLEAITRTKEIYLLLQPELEKLVKK